VPDWAHEPGPIDRLSPATSATIRVTELRHSGDHIRPGNTRYLLRLYRDFLRRPERTLRLTVACCPAPGCEYDDLAIARDALEEVAAVLPHHARTELRGLLLLLDSELHRRTLPQLDPDRWRDWRGEPLPWWHRRVHQDG
jgi:hypothetical protein